MDEPTKDAGNVNGELNVSLQLNSVPQQDDPLFDALVTHGDQMADMTRSKIERSIRAEKRTLDSAIDTLDKEIKSATKAIHAAAKKQVAAAGKDRTEAVKAAILTAFPTLKKVHVRCKFVAVLDDEIDGVQVESKLVIGPTDADSSYRDDFEVIVPRIQADGAVVELIAEHKALKDIRKSREKRYSQLEVATEELVSHTAMTKGAVFEMKMQRTGEEGEQVLAVGDKLGIDFCEQFGVNVGDTLRSLPAAHRTDTEKTQSTVDVTEDSE